MTQKLMSLILSVVLLFSCCIQANAETIPKVERKETLL